MNEQAVNIVVEHYDNDELAKTCEALADAYFDAECERKRVKKENEELREVVRCLLTCASERGNCDDCPMNDGYGVWDFDDFCEGLPNRLSSLGFEVE